MKRHQYKQAISDYTAAIVGDPHGYFLFQGRAEARRALGDLAGAAKDLNTAVEMFPMPTNASRRTVLAKLLMESAQVLLDMGNNAGAANEIRAGLKIVPPGDAYTRGQLQQLLVASGQ
jgi:tetratricopeptide (TPR) repeat protein